MQDFPVDEILKKHKLEFDAIDFEKMQNAMLQLAEEILLIQGNGDYEEAKKMVEEKGYIRDELLEDLYRIQKEHIAKDVVFIQGLDVLGIEE